MNEKAYWAMCALLLVSSLTAKTNRETTIIGSDTVVTVRSFYPSGEPKEKSRYLNGKIDGEQISWYISGKIESADVYHNDCPPDTMRSFYENGRLKAFEAFSLCKPNGRSVSYDSLGFAWQKWNFLNGNQVGPQQEWYGPNRLKHFSNYDSTGEKDGADINWDSLGVMTDSTIWKHGKRQTITVFYPGSKVPIIRAKRAKLVHSDKVFFMSAYLPIDAEYYAPNGKECGKVVDGDGEVTRYSEDGKRMWHETYKGGKIAKTDYAERHKEWVQQGLIKEKDGQ
jgi:antitoxin component YwqK of YwqJK toxin-antitoxin module